MTYNNFHKHTDYSNISTPDVIVKPMNYINRMKELGHINYFTTEHRYGGNFLEAYDLCQLENFKMIFGVEAYIVKNRLEKDNGNYHIVLIAKNINGFKQINKILSKSNIDGFYYKSRIDLELILELNPEDIFITSACFSGIASVKLTFNDFIKPIYNHFKNNFFLETQAHLHKIQIEHNKNILEISNKYNISLIHGNDSHYIYPDQSEDRNLFLKGKGIKYKEEVGFILDYPDLETIQKRYLNQKVLSIKQINNSIENTLIFNNCENLNFNKDIKMPSIYKDQDKNFQLRKILNEKWKIERKSIPEDRWNEYKEAIKFEYNIIEKTNMTDYFLLNEKIINKAINEYGGILSKTGRGSAVSFYINKLLGFTEIDRLDSEINLYPTRFMSISRILESKSLPDIDFNWVDIEPPVKSAKDILGEDCVYYMIAYGTMKESCAFRNMCRAIKSDMEEEIIKIDKNNMNKDEIKNIENRNKNINEKIKQFNYEYNEVGKNLENYITNEKWSKIIKDSKKFIGVIDNISPSPCSFLLLDKPISEELGLLKVGTEICACIDGYTADVWKYLKNDFLTVKVWKIISETFKILNIPMLTIKELRLLLDEKIWILYEKKLTATLNQIDTDMSSQMVSEYCPKTVNELSAFVAAIRPGFASLLNKFLNRKTHTTGILVLDEVLKDSFCYMLYQESIMKFLIWCGLSEDSTYDVIKKIAKKKFKEEELNELKSKLIKGFINNVGSDEKFNDIWQVIEDAVKYAFNASHSLSVAWDSIYGAYLKANHSLIYFTVVLNNYSDNMNSTFKIFNELHYFNISLNPIKFRYSKDIYWFDKVTNSIYKGLSSIKGFGEKGHIGDKLYTLKDNKYDTFLELLNDICKNLKIGFSNLKILIKLSYFSEFGNDRKLYKFLEYYEKYVECKTFKKKDIIDETIILLLKQCCEESDLSFTKFDEIKFFNLIWDQITEEKTNLYTKIKDELEYYGYIQTTIPKLSEDYAVVLELNTKSWHPIITLYRLSDGTIEKIKVDGKNFKYNEFKQFDIIKTIEKEEDFKNKYLGKDANGKNMYEKLQEKEWKLTQWKIVDVE